LFTRFNKGKIKQENLLQTTLDVSLNPMFKNQKRRIKYMGKKNKPKHKKPESFSHVKQHLDTASLELDNGRLFGPGEPGN